MSPNIYGDDPFVYRGLKYENLSKYVFT